MHRASLSSMSRLAHVGKPPCLIKEQPTLRFFGALSQVLLPWLLSMPSIRRKLFHSHLKLLSQIAFLSLERPSPTPTAIHDYLHGWDYYLPGIRNMWVLLSVSILLTSHVQLVTMSCYPWHCVTGLLPCPHWSLLLWPRLWSRTSAPGANG